LILVPFGRLAEWLKLFTPLPSQQRRGQARITHFRKSTDDTNEFDSDIDDTNEFDDDIDDNTDSKRQEKWVENSATSTLVVTRDIRG
jgi:hypothetical protein